MFLIEAWASSRLPSLKLRVDRRRAARLESRAVGDDVTVEKKGPVAVWTIDRPGRLNALSRAVVQRLGELAIEAAVDAEVRAVVLTGAGDKAFSAGADLKERQSMTAAEVHAFLDVYRDSFWAIDRCPKPVVAAINGIAFGGGLEVALACDLRVADPAAQMGLTEARLGIIPGAGGTQRLPRLIGAARAKELILTGRRIDAATALSLGVVNKVSAPGQAVAEALALCAEILESAPISVAMALRAIDAGLDRSLGQGLAAERAAYEVTLGTEDRLEGLHAFTEKRKPIYRGK